MREAPGAKGGDERQTVGAIAEVQIDQGCVERPGEGEGGGGVGGRNRRQAPAAEKGDEPFQDGGFIVDTEHSQAAQSAPVRLH